MPEVSPLGGMALVGLVIAFLGSLLTGVLKRAIANIHPPIANVGCCLLVAVVLALLLPLAFKELPRDLASWLGTALSAAGIGGAAHFSLVKKPQEEAAP